MKFQNGDLVDLVPFESTTEHVGISKGTWDRLANNNPNAVKIIGGVDYPCLQYKGFTYYFFEEHLLPHSLEVYDIEEFI